MDKFGIFNLLNSFFNFYQDKNSGASTQKNHADSGAGDKGASTSDSLFGGLFNQFKTSDEQNLTKQDSGKPNPPTQTPLQAQMLKTITTHEEIVRRVKSKNE